MDSEYKNSRLIDYNWWSDSKHVDELVTFLCVGGGSRKWKDFVINMKVLVLNLYYSHVIDLTQYVSYFGDNTRYKFIRRYNPNKVISFKYLTDAIDHLLVTGYISFKRGGHFYDEIEHDYYGYTNKIRSTQKLAALFGEYKLTPEMVCRFDYDAGLIVMKDLPEYKTIINRKGKKKKVKIKRPIDFEETRYTTAMVKVLSRYNRLLDRTYIDIDSECISEVDKKKLTSKKQPAWKRNKKHLKLDLTRKRVYRVFNNRSFKQGGRFYGSWWMGCPSVLRKYIYLDGEPTVELDFSGIHIHLLYALRGINYAALKQDSYELVPKDPMRKLNKLLLLTAINADSPKAAVNSTFKQLVDEGEHHDYDLGEHPKKRLHKILEDLKLKHTPIAYDIASDKGVILQNYDSTIIEKLVKHYTARNIPILSVHDSVICQTRLANFVKDKMVQYYCDLLNRQIKLNIPFQSLYPQKEILFRINRLKHKYELPDFTKLRENNPVLGRLDYRHVPIKMCELMIPVDTTAKKVACTKKCNFSLRYKEFRESGKVYYLCTVNIAAQSKTEPVTKTVDDPVVCSNKMIRVHYAV